VILAVSVDCIGSEGGLLLAAVRAGDEKDDTNAKNTLADVGHVDRSEITALEGRAEPAAVYAPPPRPLGDGSATSDRYTRLPGDGALIGCWRERLGPDAAMTTRRRRRHSLNFAPLATRTAASTRPEAETASAVRPCFTPSPTTLPSGTDPPVGP
jgi:hypothetical protein